MVGVRSPCVWWTAGSAIEQSPCAPPVQGAHMKMIVRAFVFCPEKGGWKEGKENLTQQRIKGA